MKVAILLNARAGGFTQVECEQRTQEILAACRAADVQATAHLCDPARLSVTARQIARDTDVDAVIAAGGDGTVSAVAAGLLGTNVALGVIPLGTLNHFAKDLGIKDVETAIAAIASGATKRIDVGEVNGRVFINNSSIGLYPELVVERETERRRSGRSRWLAMARAALRTLLRFPLLHVAIALAGSVFSTHTPFVLVGNNEYALSVPDVGSRKRLDAGRLSIYTLRSTSRWRMFAMMVRSLLRRRDPELERISVTRADIVTNKRTLRVALDGEVTRMAPPLSYRSRPGALVVLGGNA
ncbi:MAG TPA: diacylglycerol kinase family protein [Kofleriaceae bacterium]|nr:diacylglycerol kinase family protein [Kofleriaceae bacterium]